MKLVLAVLRWSVIGALTSTVIMALYRYYIITSSGFSVVSIPIKTMMIDVMGLPLYAGMGAGVGALLGMASRLERRWCAQTAAGCRHGYFFARARGR